MNLKSRQETKYMDELENKLLAHSSICPNCKNEMEFGYLGGGYVYLFWWPIKKKLHLFIKKPRKKALSLHSFHPSYICRRCHLTITQYNQPTTISERVESTLNNEENRVHYCPYCNKKQLEGYIFGSWGLFLIPFITWSEKYGKEYWASRKIYLTARPLLGLSIQKIPANKCVNCGVIFSFYDPKKIKKSNIYGAIFWTILLLIMTLILLQGW